MLTLSGCQSMTLLDPIGTVQTSPVEVTTADLDDQVIVFGRIRWINNGEERANYRNNYGWNIWPLYYRVEDKENGVLGVTETGHFAWQLPVGTYILYHARWFDDIAGQRRLPLRLTFKAEKTGKAYCIGTLTIDLHSTRDALGMIKITSWNTLIDEGCEQERIWFTKRYTQLKIPVENTLLLHDARIPDTIVGLENKQRFSEFIQSLYFLLLPIQ